MPTFTLASDLAAPAEAVWAHVTTMAGINDELRPWLAMRPPRRWRGASFDELPLQEPLGRAWILLGGVLPVEYDDLVLDGRGPGRVFQERSAMLAAREWTHRRSVEPYASGCRLTDVVGVEPRLPALSPVAVRVARAVFVHRHRRLARRFGSPAR